jgi:enamine deaminase RidA (YjgF/YER057c/UK114 family)
VSREYFSQNSAYPFADAVLVDNRTLYLSGRIGLLPGKSQVPATAEEEARLVLNDVKNVLALAGMTMDHIVSLQVFCSDVSLWEPFNAIYRTYFAGPLPPRAFLGSGTLLFNARFELMGIAIKDADLPNF